MTTSRSNPRNHRTRRIALGVVAAITIAACGSDDDTDGTATPNTDAPVATEAPVAAEAPVATEAPVETDPPTNPPITEAPATDSVCGPIGTLMELDLNDRCVTASGAEIEWESGELDGLGIWTTIDHACDVDVVVTAVPNQLLVAADNPSRLATAVTAVKNELGNLIDDGVDGTSSTPFAQLIDLDEGTDIEDIVALLPTLQGVGWSTDLNYLEPLQPNNGFRPDDDPQQTQQPSGYPAEFVQLESAEGARVLVLDSTDDQDEFDKDGNGLVDEDHGHGMFVASIIDRAVPGMVWLEPVTNATPRLPSGRWAPMMFSDFDIAVAMNNAFSSTVEFVNLSLGGPGCSESHVGERLALARAMRAHVTATGNPESPTVFVAAAGNHGGEIKHFPAAWRDDDATAALVEAVMNADVLPEAGTAEQIAADINALHDYFVESMFAVGSVDAVGGATSKFSNCGGWVNATAVGSEVVGYYPTSPTKYATWSGTSFATANVTAHLAAGQSSDQGVTGVTGFECHTDSETETSEPDGDPDEGNQG